MATLYFGVDVGGQGAADVTVDTSTTSSDVELAVVDTNLAAGDEKAKQRILECLEAIEAAVLQRNY